MIRLIRLHLLDLIAEKLGYTTNVLIPGTGSPGITAPRDVLYCQIDISARKRKEFLNTLGQSSDLEFPYASFYCTNIDHESSRYNLTLAKYIGISTEEEETEEVALVPFLAEFQIDCFATKDTDDDLIVKNWLFWKSNPSLSFTDTSGHEWEIPIDFVNCSDNSSLEVEYEGGAFYRRTMMIEVHGFSMKTSTIETILSINWATYNLDGTVSFDSGTIVDT